MTKQQVIESIKQMTSVSDKVRESLILSLRKCDYMLTLGMFDEINNATADDDAEQLDIANAFYNFTLFMNQYNLYDDAE